VGDVAESQRFTVHVESNEYLVANNLTVFAIDRHLSSPQLLVDLEGLVDYFIRILMLHKYPFLFLENDDVELFVEHANEEHAMDHLQLIGKLLIHEALDSSFIIQQPLSYLFVLSVLNCYLCIEIRNSYQVLLHFR
jgi:hypothetical protein